MGNKFEPVGRRKTPKMSWEQAVLDLSLEDAEKIIEYAKLNNGVQIKLCVSDKTGKEYAVIDTFRKQIPVKYGGSEQDNNSQQESKSYSQPERKYESKDRPPVMPTNNQTEDDDIPFNENGIQSVVK